jgi:peptidoglycan/xylan/chitin deacetylase (PgdA/CDA1 family)
MTGWDDLARECAAWGEAGRTATWWWRDDDAIEPTPALQTLVSLSDTVALAVIPSRMRPELGDFLRAHPGIAVLQHGFAHVNHARSDERKSEFPDSRDTRSALDDLRRGSRILQDAFGIEALPVLTPPWNRAGDGVLAGLRELGFTGLTRYLPRRAAQIHDLKQVNTHVDMIDWKGNRGFVGESEALTLLIGHLAARRAGAVDPDEPTGLLTHHLVHDPATWRFLEKLRDFLKKQSAVRLLDPSAVFETGKFPER